MNIFITGGAGYIGSKLTKILLEKNYKVTIFDKLLFGGDHLLHFNSNKNFNFIKGDIRDKKSLKEANIQKNDFVIHLASIVGYPACRLNPELATSTNIDGTKNILELCKKFSVKMIHFSSTSIYGTTKKVVDENCDKGDINPQSPYAETKFKEELLVQNFFENQGLKSKTLRLGSICGTSPGMRFHAAISKFCFQASTGQSLSVWETALNQKRPYLNLNDATRAIAFVIENNLFDGGVFNLVTANSTVQEIVNTIRKFEPQVKIEFVKSKIMNNLSYDVSSQKFKDKGFIVSNNLDEGIKDTISLFKSINSYEI